MSEKIFTVAILGCGGRGGEAYGRLFAKMPEKFRIVSVCDYNSEKLKKYGKIFGVPEEMLFSDEKEFFAAKRAGANVRPPRNLGQGEGGGKPPSPPRWAPPRGWAGGLRAPRRYSRACAAPCPR